MKPQVTIIHGDCLSILPTLDRGSIDAVLTDPPYGMAWNTDSNRFSNKRGRSDWGDIAGDDQPFDPTTWLEYPKVILWGFNHFAARLPVGTTLVWVKRNEAGYGSFLSDAELAWMKGGHGVYCFRDASGNTGRLAEAKTKTLDHPSQKPIGLMRWCLERLKLAPGSTVLDPYAGSGTTAVACMQMGLNCIAIESETKYIPVIERRVADARTPLLDLCGASA